MPTDVVSQAEFGRELGITGSRVAQLIKRGLPVDKNRKVRRAAALRWCEDNLDTGKRARNSSHVDGDLKRRIDELKIEREELALAKERGELVEAAPLRKAWFARGRQDRDAWTSWAMRNAPLIAAEIGCDGAKLFAALDREVRVQLKELSETPVEGVEDDDA